MPVMTSNQMVDPIVITGISGRLPECSNIDEFRQKLFDGFDMVTTDDRRWPAGINGIPKRFGKLKDIKSFDAKFFGVLAKHAHLMDPQLRLLLEVTYEAIIDAGLNPLELKGSKTGVYVGSCVSESLQFYTNGLKEPLGYSITGCSKSMFANRISYTFDFNGPSFTIDSACSSSTLALQQAFDAIKSGQCDSAIVAGTNLLLNPHMHSQFHKLRLLSPDGKCKSFDASGDGYVRSESVVALLLQKSITARRVYATILGAKTNTDGNKERGIMHPSQKMQNKLINEVYSECGIDPADVVYLETHGTGTKIGDPQELNSAVDAFCTSNRKKPLLIGSVKSNMGHSEPASGLCSIAKIIIAMEYGVIPSNLHFRNPNPHIPGLIDGRLKVVSKNEKWTGGIVGVNSFGFGGANVHIILSSNPKEKSKVTAVKTLRLLTVSGRTFDSVNYFLDKIMEEPYDEEFYALIDKIHSRNIAGHSHRGYCLIGEQISKDIGEVTCEKPPIWFIFTGMGCEWPGMGKVLMTLEPFRNSIERSAEILKVQGIDLINIIVDGNGLGNVRNSMVFVTATQIALVDLLKFLNIEPDGMIGHSIGEIGCAYADGTVTSEQAILLSYVRGTSILESELPSGVMASVGISMQEFKKRAPSDIYMACHNSEDNLTISGPSESIKTFLSELDDEGFFSKAVNIFGLAFHSKYIAQAGPKLKKALNALIPNPKRRSPKWISSSIPESDWDKPLAALSSADYHVNNFLSPVCFYEATRHIPENAIVLELAPHHLLQSILKRSLPKSVTNIGLLKMGHPDNVEYLLSNIGKLYKFGGNPNISAIYPGVSFPVSRGTPMLASMIQWDHSMEYAVANFCSGRSRSGELVIEVDLSKDEFKYLNGHVIDGKNIFPETGYITMVWETFAKLKNEEFQQLPVILEDVKFLRPIILPKVGSVKFLMNFFEGAGEFKICESGSVVASGRIYVPSDIDKEFLKFPPQGRFNVEDILPLNASDVYKELRLRGYNYDGSFRGITNFDHLGVSGNLIWEKKWVTFIDAMLQFSILRNITRKLYLPIKIQKIIINPKSHMDTDSEQIPVCFYNKNNVIKSGGIELRGLEYKLAPARKETQTAPILQTYQFIPLENNVSLAEVDALTVATQLVFENSAGALKLRVVEVLTENYAGTYVLLKVKEILETERMVSVDATIVTSIPIDVAGLEENSIKVDRKDLVASHAHLVILRCALLNECSKVIANALSSLKPGGFILFRESQSQNLELIRKHSLSIVYQQVTENEIFILARKAVEIPDNPIIIKISEKHYDWIESLKATMNEANKSKIYLLCQGEKLSGILGLMTCLMQEPGGLNVRCIFIQDTNAEPFRISSAYYRNLLEKDLALNVLKNGVWGTFRHLFLDKNIVNKKRQVKHAFINPTIKSDLSSLQWIERPMRCSVELELCTVYYSALNCKDVKVATGEKVNVCHRHEDYLLGLEFSGRDSNGKRVMGVVDGGSLATTVSCEPNFLWEIPETWSLEDAATIPFFYSVSYYALKIRGRMQPGETILIHAGSKGISQASIYIALHMKCNVFTTARDQVERVFIKKIFPELLDDYIGNIHDTSFEQIIQNKTNGRGVDLVLNTLSEEQLQASMRCLAYGGRLLHISNVDIINDSSLGLSIFSKNITFHGIILDSLFYLSQADKTEVHRLVSEGITNGEIHPLPKTTYTEHQILEAFRFLSSGKNFEKVLLKIRFPPNKYFPAIAKSYMNPEKVYVLIGGLGGLGLELINWLVTRGAKKIVISSRNGIKSGYQSLCIRRWKNQNVTIKITTVDVTTEEGANELLNEANSFGSVGGIFNLAVVLKDALMCNQTEELFKISCRPKSDTTKHLDTLSRILTPDLDYFVVFSTVSCGRGSSGQTNYGYSNSIMERVCENRHASGLPALAIQWGPIRDVGLLSETGITEHKGALLQSISSCMSTFDILLQQSNPVVSSFVLPKRITVSEGVKPMHMADAVGNILGLTNRNGISNKTTLAQFGMDSLMSADIKTTLERDYDLMLNSKEIRDLTFARLVELERGLHTAKPLEDILENGRIFVIHPTEGVADDLKALARIYHLQFITSVPLNSIADLASYYIKEMKKIQVKGPYVLIGYSFGACVAFEMGLQLEANNDKAKIMFVDGSPEYFSNQAGRMMIRSDKASEERESVLFYLHQLMGFDNQKTVAEIMANKTSESESPTQTTFVNTWYKKIVAAERYIPSATFNGDAMLVKASDNCMELSEDYGLNAICRQKIRIKTLSGTQHSVIKNPELLELVNSFCQYV